jgi:excisionase family DNA binding protein
MMQRDETVLAVGMAEAARRIGLSPRTVANLVLTGKLPSQKIGRRRLIRVTELENLLRDDRQATRRRRG